MSENKGKKYLFFKFIINALFIQYIYTETKDFDNKTLDVGESSEFHVNLSYYIEVLWGSSVPVNFKPLFSC